MSSKSPPTQARAALNNPVVRSGHKIPFYPTGDRVVVERLEVDEEKVGGIVIPGSTSEIFVPGVTKANCKYATVIAAGPFAMDVLRDMAVDIGDTVCIGQWTGVAWEWRVPGTVITERVDVINVKDIYGCAELVDKIVDGEMSIDLHPEQDGKERHRFFLHESSSQGVA